MWSRRFRLVLVLLLVAGLAVAAPEAGGEAPHLDVPYVPTPQPVVDAMLEVAGVTGDDVVYDLGSGDGRIVITAARKHGARGVGYDLDPARVKEARENAREAGVENRVRFEVQNVFAAEFREATVVTMYLLPDVNQQLKPRLLAELRPGTRIVSHAFDLGDWKADKVLEVKGEHGNHTVYYWVVPPRKPAR